MKICFISLSLLCAAGLAHADGMPGSAPAPQAEAAQAAQAPAKASRSTQRKPARLPQGDLRHCLDLDNNLAIIRCAEKQPRR
jgi:hypothetical protein